MLSPKVTSLGLASLLLACSSNAQRPAPIAPSRVESSHAAARPHRDVPVTLRYLGVAGWELETGSHRLLFDPYFTRAEVKDAALPLSPDQEEIARYAPPQADLILVGHSHYDHLLDVPDIARRTGALVVGTQSTLNVAKAAGLTSPQLRLAHPGEHLDQGPFRVHVLRALHSLIGVPSVDIPANVTLPMGADAYGEGGTLQYLVEVEGRRILFMGSANFVESELLGRRPDVAIVATGFREKVPDYSCRLMRALGEPPLVLANHFDALWRPLGPEQMSIGDEAHQGLAQFADEVHKCAPQARVLVPVHLEPISI